VRNPINNHFTRQNDYARHEFSANCFRNPHSRGQVAHSSFFCVQFHDMLYKMSPDILYTPAQEQSAVECEERWAGRRWMYGSSEWSLS